MTKVSAIEALGRIGALAALLSSLLLTVPIKEAVKVYAVGSCYLEPVAGSLGMLASFVAFTALAALLIVPPYCLWIRCARAKRIGGR